MTVPDAARETVREEIRDGVVLVARLTFVRVVAALRFTTLFDGVRETTPFVVVREFNARVAVVREFVSVARLAVVEIWRWRLVVVAEEVVSEIARRTAARATSPPPSACAPYNPIDTRHAAKISLNFFILCNQMLAKL